MFENPFQLFSTLISEDSFFGIFLGLDVERLESRFIDRSR